MEKLVEKDGWIDKGLMWKTDDVDGGQGKRGVPFVRK